MEVAGQPGQKSLPDSSQRKTVVLACHPSYGGKLRIEES
jgi:hypothetical protein